MSRQADEKRLRRVAQANRQVNLARKALERAGAAYLRAIEATDEEIEAAGEMIDEIKRESVTDMFIGPDYDARLAEQVLNQRQADAEDALDNG